jgi:hypothetical protein
MLTVYDTLLRLPADPKSGETTEFAACAHSRVLLTMSADDFRVEHKDGKASVYLSRHLTHEQARELAKSIVERVDQMELHEKQWAGVYGTTVLSEGSVINVVNVNPIIGSRE